MKIELEKKFHNDAFSDNRRSILNKYYLSTSSARSFYKGLISSFSKNKRVLEYGCGPRSEIFSLADHASQVYAIDISEVAIEKAQLQAHAEKKKINFSVMNAESLLFNEDSLDLVFGSGILHHLDIHKSYAEISRVLGKTGCAIFFEPLGHNPVINLFRKLTPNLRTADEHPLLINDLEMANNYFYDVDVKYFNLFSTIGSFLPFLTKSLSILDSIIFNKLPYMKKYAWICVVTLKNPRKLN